MVKSMNFYDKICLFFSEPRKVLILTFCAGVLLAFISILFSGFIYGDAVLYTTMAHYFGLGDYSRGFLDQIPPLFSVLSGLLCKLGIPAQYSTHIVSCTLCIISIFPLYFLLCFFMDKKYAAWGCMFYLFAPKILRFGMASQIEGARFFFLILPIYFVFSFAKNKKIPTLIWLGISFALLALVRGEGILFVPIMLFALILLLFKNNQYNINSNFIIKTFGYCLLSIIIMFAIIAPRMYQVYQHTGYPALDARETESIKTYWRKIKNFYNKPTRIISHHNVPSLSDQGNNQGHFFSFKRIFSFLDRFSVGSYELYEILSVLGIFFLLRQKKWSLEHNIMLMFILWNALIFYFIVLTYRYFLVNVFLLIPFIIPGYRLILNITKKHKIVQILFSITVLLIALGQIENGMADSLESKRKEPKRFGQWLKENKASLLNPQKNNNERLHILVFGNRPDYPFFADADFSIGENQDFPNIRGIENSKMNIRKAVKGFPAKYSYYTNKLLPLDEIIIPDIIVITPPEDFPEEVAIVRSISNLREIKTNFKDFLLFKNLNYLKR